MTVPLLTYRGRGGPTGDVVRVKLETLYETRLLIQGSSGAGKTQACFHLLEETHGQVQQIVIDKEGEFAKLREQFDYLLIGGDGEQRIPMRKGALELQLHRVLELEISAIYDLSDLVPDQQRHVVARLARAMAHLPQRSGLWDRMRLALFDEMQWWAPQNGKAESLEPCIELASTGRKRGFCFIAAGTRVSMMAKSVTELLENKLIGRSGMNDAERAAKELEFDKHGRKELRSLPIGHFYAYGPAIAIDPVLVRTPAELPVLPRRRGEHRAPTPATSAKVKRALVKFAGLEEEAEKKERTLEELQTELAGARGRIRLLEKGAPVIDPTAIARERERAAAAAVRVQAPTITALRRALEAAMKFIVTVSTHNFDVAGVDKEELARAIGAAVEKATQLIDQRLTTRERQVEKMREDARRLLATLKGLAEEQDVVVSVDVAKNAPFTVTPAPKPAAARREPIVRGDGSVSPKQLELLTTLRSFEHIGVTAVPRPNLAAFVGYAASTKAFKNNLAEMRTGGLIEYSGDGIQLTEAGRAIAGDRGQAILTLDALHQAWRDRLAPADWKLLEPVLEAHVSGNGLPRDVLAAQVGYATSTKAFKNGLSKLRTLGAIDYRGGEIVATSMMFPEALT